MLRLSIYYSDENRVGVKLPGEAELNLYRETEACSALHKLKRKIPYGWDLNIYRGCAHACSYCYALYTHCYVNPNGAEEFSKDIIVKINIVDLLEKELRSQSWQREVINIGGVTDSYQPAELDHRLMPDILKLLIKYKTPAIISTKSDLILRDYDLIDQLSRITYINVAATITTMDKNLCKLIEPGAAPSRKRFAMLREFRKTNASIGLHVMPILPLLTDGLENFTHLFKEAADCGVDYVLPGVLYLRGQTRSFFFAFLEREFPGLLEKYMLLYKTGGADKGYKSKLYGIINPLRDSYGLGKSYMTPMRARLKEQ
jgi:DNA repair photolyase